MIGQRAKRTILTAMLLGGIGFVVFALIFRIFFETVQSDISRAVLPATIGATFIFLAFFLKKLPPYLRLTPFLIVGGFTLIFATAYCFFQMFFSDGGAGLIGFLGMIVCAVLAGFLVFEQWVIRFLRIKSYLTIIIEILLLPLIYFLLVQLFIVLSA